MSAAAKHLRAAAKRYEAAMEDARYDAVCHLEVAVSDGAGAPEVSLRLATEEARVSARRRAAWFAASVASRRVADRG